MSLQLLLERLDRTRFEPIVALARPSAEVLAYHRAAGCEVIPWPGIETVEHTTAAWTAVHRPGTWPMAARAALGWRRSERRTRALVERVRPDLVHLNSAVLVPSARALAAARVPFVWHVRETPVGLGIRTSLLGRALREWPAAPIFLSPLARRLWGAEGRGQVIPESVDFARFRPEVEPGAARRALGIAPDARVVLFLGGSSALKGIWPLLRALDAARRREPRLVCLLPGVQGRAPGSAVAALARRVLPAVGLATPVQRMERSMATLGTACRPLAFSAAPEQLLHAADVLAFPALLDHFARPIVEAWATGTPVVASRLPMIEELMPHGEGGLLVPPGDAGALCAALLELLGDPARAAALAARGRTVAAARCDVAANTAAQEQVYEAVLGGARGAAFSRRPVGPA